jgi:hypothetical protein
MDLANVRRDLRRALRLVPGLEPKDWTPRELRHSFVSLLSDAGVPVEMISQLVGHRGTSVIEIVYRHQIRPVIQTGTTVMDELFGQAGDAPVVTQLVTQLRADGHSRHQNHALTWVLTVGDTGFEPVTSSV